MNSSTKTQNPLLDDFQSCLDAQKALKKEFPSSMSKEEKYKKIMEIGRKTRSSNMDLKSRDLLVQGCQSEIYLRSSLKDGLLYFEFFSQALISSGLAALLCLVYSRQPPAAILKCPPLFLEELDIQASLSPSRSNGLASLHIRMKQDAIKALMQ